MSLNCGVCGLEATLKCSACKLVAYCCKDHQKSHWKTHKKLCRPFQVKFDEEKGKFLVATRDIQKGDVILMEYPLVFGPRPHMVEEGPVPCPGCCRLILGEQSQRCPGCDFPVCGPNCEGLKDKERHGHECVVLGLREVQAINGLHNFYRQDTLLALRCLLLQVRHPKKFETLMEMQAHLERRGEDTEIYKDLDQRVADYLLSNFLDPMKILEGRTGRDLMKFADRKTIHKICGIIDVNALEINQEGEVSALYPTASLLEHSCYPNTVHFFDKAQDLYKITVKACRNILKGEPISTMYTHALWGTQARREHLQETKYFSCKCIRCSDPTELNSFLSGLKCPSELDCCSGTQLPEEPLNPQSDWACNKCDIKLKSHEVTSLVNQIGEEVDQVQLNNPTVKDLDNLLNKMLMVLHPNHYHVYSVKHSLVQLFGYQQGYLPSQISDDTLERKAKMCRELLEVTRKIDPGNARLPLYTGVVLHELYLANMIVLKRKFDLGIKAKVKGTLALIKECKLSLEEAKEVLSCERNTPAGEKLCNLIGASGREFAKWLDHNKIDLS